jgi:hypothetical protein
MKKTKRIAPNKLNLDILPADWQTQIIEIYKDGGMDSHVRLWIRTIHKTFSNTVWKRWLAEEDEFRETIEYGHDLCYIHWLDMAKNNLQKRDFNNSAWSKIMTNCFNWKDTNIQMDTVEKVTGKKYEGMEDKALISHLNDEINSMRD